MNPASWSAVCTKHVPPSPSRACTFFSSLPSPPLNQSPIRPTNLPHQSSLSTLLALTLDIRTHRHTTHLGHYNRMNEPLDLKRPTPTPTPIISSPSPIPQYPPYSSQRADHSMMTGDLGEYRVRREEFEVQHFRKGGYEAPSEQTRYDPGLEGRF